MKELVCWINNQPLWVKVQLVVAITLLVILIRTFLENLFIESTNGTVIFLTKYSSIFLAAGIWFWYNEQLKKP